ncbi:MAG: hypothetical protein ACOCW6_00560 [Spirochaetota bacterium]
MERRFPLLLSFVVLILLTISIMPSPTYGDPADTPGVWREGQEGVEDHVDRRGSRIPREPNESQLQDMFDRLGAIVDLFRSTPTLGSPVGFDVKASRGIDLGRPEWAEDREAAARARLSLYLYPYLERRDGTVKASDLEWTGIIGVYVNDPAPYEVMGAGMNSLEGERWYLEPVQIRTVAGYTMYEQVADDRVRRRGPQRFFVVAPPDLPPLWLPVSAEEYATDQIRRWEMQLALARERLAQFSLPARSETHRMAREAIESSMQQLMELTTDPEQRAKLQAQMEQALREHDEAAGDLEEADRAIAEDERRMIEAAEKQQAELEETIEAMKASLAAMSPAERRAQAVGKLHLHRPGAQAEGEIVPPTVPGGSEPRGLVRINRDLFERRHSPADMHFFFVNFYTNSDFMARQFAAVERELDWSELAGMIPR